MYQNFYFDGLMGKVTNPITHKTFDSLIEAQTEALECVQEVKWPVLTMNGDTPISATSPNSFGMRQYAAEHQIEVTWI